MTTGLSRSLDSASQPRSVLRRAVFRFAFAYWTLFCIPVVATQLIGFEWIGRAIEGSWAALVRWAGKALFAIPHALSIGDNGSADRAGHWVLLGCIAILALIAAAAWSLIDRARTDDPRARALLHVIVRYTLAFTVLGSGILKVLGVQFPELSDARLLQRYGDSSPMTLLWTFMGASPVYAVCSGALEVLGAALVLFRRTATLGALVLACVLTNVAMLNFCYDVPAKINSAHYVAMCLFLMSPDLRRLANLLWFHRPTEPAPPAPRPSRTRLAIKSIMIGIVLAGIVRAAIGYLPTPSCHTWCDSFWTVARFTRDGQDVAPIITDATRWSRLRFQPAGDLTFVRWSYMDESIGDLYTATTDEASRTVTFTHERAEEAANRPVQPEVVVFRYAQSDAHHITLEGTLGDQLLIVELERIDTGHMTLASRGFHWITEQPYQR